MKYRADIDGLRTLAVVPVILFHAGASWLPGGFVGVDIFFVISGYLISTVLLRDIQADNFSYLNFYERRLRRIIPALVAMIITTIFLFQLIALPDQAEEASKSGIAALLSVSNFFFWQTSGYFSPTSEFMPLLHTWSLAVEEQFYIVFPILLAVMWKFKISYKWGMALGTILAFIVGVWLSINKPSVAYYLLPARAWELAIGALLAVGVIPKLRNSFMREAVPIVGVASIIVSLFYINSSMIFPGYVALLPCLGAALIIHSDGTSWIARQFLSSRPMVFIGLISYSLYLWHWPILSMLRIRTANLHLNLGVTIVAIVLTFILAWLSWRYVERPFRNKKTMSISRVMVTLGAASVVLTAICVISVLNSGFPSRLNESASKALAASQDVDSLRNPCKSLASDRDCKFGNPSAPIRYAVIGDSHASAVRPAIEASGLLGKSAGTLYWEGACPLLEGASVVNSPAKQARCLNFKTSVWNGIETSESLDTIILSGRWAFQMTGWLPESGGGNRTWFADEKSTESSIEENLHVFKRSFIRTLDRLEAKGLKVIIIGTIPEPGFDVPHIVALSRQSNLKVPKGIFRKTIEERAGRTDDIIAEMSEGRENVQFISIWNSFCDEAWCKIEHEGVPIYYDDDHLSFTGAVSFAAPAIASQLGN